MTEVQNQHQDPITTENNSIETVVDHPDPRDTNAAKTDPVSRETEQEPDKPVKFWQDDKRAQLGAKAREIRAAETLPFDGDLTNPSNRFGAEVDTSQVDKALRAPPKRDEQGRFAAADDDNIEYNDAPSEQQYQDDITNREVEVNVYGQRRNVKVADLIAKAQMYEAGDTKLQEARAIVENLKQLSMLRQHQRSQSMQPDTSGAFQQQGQPVPQQGPNQSPAVDYDALAEKLQLGSAKEAGEALKALVEKAKAEAMGNYQPQSQPDIATAVRATHDDIATQTALRDFASANPDIVSDPVAQQVTATYAHMSMLHDLRQLGFSDQDLASAIRTDAHLVAAHKAARMHGLARPTASILNDATALTRQRFGSSSHQQPQPQQLAQPAPTVDRSERKRNIMTQPAVRRAPGMNDQPEAPKTVEQSRQDRFQRMKQGRGQLTG